MLTETQSCDLNAIQSVAELDDALSAPTPGVIETLKKHTGDILVLGIGGKMGPTLSRMIKRASDQAGTTRRIIGVSRFGSSNGLQEQLNSWGIETIVCDLLKPGALAKLPDAPIVIYMAGMKFGSTGKEAQTWAMNVHLPALVAERYKNSRIVAFSTGNVYGLTHIAQGGSLETDTLDPVGDYAISCSGRERMFQYAAEAYNTKSSIIRLNYAVELRYGVLVDLAQKIVKGEQIDLSMGCFNAIWQRDANAATIQSIDHASAPPFFLNLTGPELISTRRVCEQMAHRLSKSVEFVGEEANTAILSNAQLCHKLFGYPSLSIQPLIDKTIDWVSAGNQLLGKPTKFQSREGKF